MSRDKDNPRAGPYPGATLNQRRPLLRWCSWYFAITGLMMAIIGLRYLQHFSPPHEALAWFYTLVTYLGHFAFLAYLPFVLLLLPLTLVLPKRQLIVPLAVVITSIGLTLVLLDTLVFSHNRFHLNALTIAILGWKTWGFGLVYLAIILLFQSMLAKWTWQGFGKPAKRKLGYFLGVALMLSLFASHSLHAWADAQYYVPITRLTHYLPLFRPVTAKKLMVKYGLVDLEQNRERELVQRLDSDQQRLLSYPLAALQCDANAPLLNVLLILVDAMRWDVVSTKVAPNIARFGERATTFTKHYSGGNSSRMGLFSLFYGLPSSYWTSFEALHTAPLLMDKFQQHSYQLGIYGSAVLYRPVSLDRTAFAKVPNLRMETTSPNNRSYEKDQIITQEWIDWLNQRDSSRPFFGFLFYDAPNSLSFPPDYPARFKTPANATEQQKLFAQYRTSVHFDDALIGEVLHDLNTKNLLEQTVVIISADHGEEFDEAGLGFSGHGSSFSQFQLRTPLVVHWPGRPSQLMTRRTSHNDIAPTLLTELFGCSNPPSDYSSGRSLFSGHQWDWLVAGSYHNMAIVEPDQITVTYPNGYFEIRDPNYRLIETPEINREAVTQAMNEMARFYR